MTRRRYLGRAVAACGGLLAACGPLAGRQPGPPAKGPVTIEVLTRVGVTATSGHSRWYAETTPQRFTPQTQITVNFIEGPEKLIVLVSGGTPPDAAWFGIGDDALAKKGLFKPLDDLIKRDKFDRAPYWKSVLDALSVDGKQYALPTHGHFGIVVTYVNLSLARKAALNPPIATGDWTTDQLIEWAKKMTRLQDREWGFWPSTGFGEPLTFFLRLFGAQFFSPDGRRCALDSPQAREALQWMYDCQYKFQVVEDLLGAIGPAKAFEEGRLAVWNWTPARLSDWKLTAAGRERVRFEWGSTVFPRHPRGTRGTQVSGAGMGLQGTPKLDSAWQWVQFITNRDNGVLQVQGGAGSPGARQDVWTDARLLSLDPVFTLIQKTYRQPGPLDYPWNHTFAEVTQLANPKLQELWQNKAGVNEVVTSLVRDVNAILQRPPG